MDGLFVFGLCVASLLLACAVVYGSVRLLLRAALAFPEDSTGSVVSKRLATVVSILCVAWFSYSLWQIYSPFIMHHAGGETNGLIVLFGPVFGSVYPAVLSIVVSGVLNVISKRGRAGVL